MTAWFLVAVFFTASGEPMLLDGWYPLEVPSRERCIIGGQNLVKYFDDINMRGNPLVFCRYGTEKDIADRIRNLKGRPT